MTLFYLFKFFFFCRIRENPIWCIGPFDIARTSEILHRAIPDSKRIVLYEHRFHENSRFRYLLKLWSVFLGPLILSKNLALGNNFIYSGPNGYLIQKCDFRRFEFQFVKNRGSKIVCILHGDDVRSPKKMKELQEIFGRENYSSNMDLVDLKYVSISYENEKLKIAAVIDRFSDLTFNFSKDQASYLSKPTIPSILLFPDEWIFNDLSKFNNLERFVIVHAPSEPLIKGTVIIRSVINQLITEGFKIEYIELYNKPNIEVLQSLKDSHILINQLYSYVPGILSLEGMANNCVVLTSADRKIETDLPIGSEQAWVRIDSTNLYSQLRNLLVNPEKLIIQASQGNEWLKKNVAVSSAAKKLNLLLRNV